MPDLLMPLRMIGFNVPKILPRDGPVLLLSDGFTVRITDFTTAQRFVASFPPFAINLSRWKAMCFGALLISPAFLPATFAFFRSKDEVFRHPINISDHRYRSANSENTPLLSEWSVLPAPFGHRAMVLGNTR